MSAVTRVPLYAGGTDAASAAKGLILLHGRGAEAGDILALGEHLGLEDTALVAPEAAGRSWWPVSFLAPADQLARPLEQALHAVDMAMAHLQAAGIPAERIAVLGFSQGAGLALEWAARRGGPLAGVIALSGGLIGTADQGAPSPELYGFADKRLEYATRLDGVPVLMSVHERDPHIPLRRVRDSVAALGKIGADVRLTTAPGHGHGLLPGDVAAIRALLA